MGKDDPGAFSGWLGRKTEAEDLVTDRLVASFRATLEPHLAAVPAGTAPLGLHWCLSPRIAPMAELGPDGHPAKNRDLPPVPQPRRMWAGGEIEAREPLRVGDRVHLTSTIANVVRKQGRSGELWFVTVSHDYATERGLAIRDRQDLVYREASPALASNSPVTAAADDKTEREFSASWTVTPSPVLLFRYSAITFNGHRIHYDHPYATEIEGYGGLVVHGPLQATLLYNLAACQTGAVPRRFAYRGVSPALVGSDLLIRRGAAEESSSYWTQSMAGLVHMEARVADA